MFENFDDLVIFDEVDSMDAPEDFTSETITFDPYVI